MEDVASDELQAQLSTYLKRVAAGERFRVTEEGRAVALLTPAPVESFEAVRERLIAEGKIIPAKGDLLDLGPPPPLRPEYATGISSQEALDEQREERLP